MAGQDTQPTRAPEPHAISPFRTLQQQINRDFDSMFKNIFSGDTWPDWPRWPAIAWPKWEEIGPRINITEKDGVIQVEAAIPGMDNKDLDISVRDDVLTLKG